MTAVSRLYLDWQPLLEPGQIYSQPPTPQYPCQYNNRLYFIEQRAAESGRSVLVRLEDDGATTCLTPDGYNIRSRVHEYGGKAHTLHSSQLYFSNDADGVIYRQALDPLAKPQSLMTADTKAGMSIDFQVSPDEQFLVFVHEQSRPDAENENRLCYVALDQPDAIHGLVSGADFYAGPVISPDGNHLAWMEWDHPNMPWDGTKLKIGKLVQHDGRLSVDPGSIQLVAGGDECAVCQPQFADDGRLIFALDGKDAERGLSAPSWDLFVWQGGSLSRITNDEAEYGEAFWIFGQQRYCIHANGDIEAIRTCDGVDELVLIDSSNGTVSTLSADDYSSLSHLAGSANGNLFIAASFAQDSAVYRNSPEKRSLQLVYGHEPLLDKEDISIPVQLDYPTRDKGTAHAQYYPPRNSTYQAVEGDLPPMLVMVHGGPTSSCDSSLSYQRQYWTGRGFAVLDINHRGSTGYGRDYRQALLGEWGLLETADVADAVEYAIVKKLAHADQVCIRGGSAGGYEVLRALTLYPGLFCAGACYYGIGNLVTLMEITHKFEAHYLDGLLGEPFLGKASDHPGSPYYDRSPIHHLDALQSPMIIFQGLEDKVVPPALSREIVRVLEEKGIYHQYVEYEGEGHGFRSRETRIDALEKEAVFFLNVIRGTV